MTVEYKDHMGSDLRIVDAARVSFHKEAELKPDGSMYKADIGLINYMMREKHSSPFEHVVFYFRVRCSIAVAREWFRHRYACLSGDTVIQTLSKTGSGKLHPVTIEKLYRTKHGVPVNTELTQPNRVARLDSPGYRGAIPLGQERLLRVLDEGTGEFTMSRMAEVWQAGIKSVFVLRTAKQEIKASARHRFLTPGGWVFVEDLQKGDVVGIKGHVPAGNDPPIPVRLRMGIQEWASNLKRRLITHPTQCYLCAGEFAPEELEYDHVISVSVSLALALDADNLRPACRSCHRAKTNTEQPKGARSVAGVQWVPLLVDPEAAGEEMTYDIEVEGPHHNFVANMFVTHNSYNEESTRYVEMREEFYIPELKDVRMQEGKPGAYVFKTMDEITGEWVQQTMSVAYTQSFVAYKAMLDRGVAREVARNVLPLGLLTEFVTTINFRSLTNFMMLRSAPSALKEIRDEAQAIEVILTEHLPVTMKAWNECGRQAI